VLLVPAVAISWVAAPWILGLFGAAYSANAAGTLRLLALAALPVGVIVLHLTAARMDRNMPVVWAIAVSTAAASVGLAAWLVPNYGSAGAALGYLTGHAAIATALMIGRLRSETLVNERPT
jgi:O-antigen/teichoic acid export membrane protein